MGVDNLPEDVTESEMFNHARKELLNHLTVKILVALFS
jgi:hypothetical protein